MAANPRFHRTLARALFVAAPLALALGGCGVNTIPTEEENAKAKWADVQNQYQRRADLIPNLVATVKGYASHEEKTLTEVVEARAKATSVTVNAGEPVSTSRSFAIFCLMLDDEISISVRSARSPNTSRI